MSASASKILTTHLQRRACVYIRQSTPFQVAHHRESTERQYHLRQRAIELGWNPSAVDTIDEDQGLSATSADHRAGFQRLASEIVQGQIGIVLMLEASRLSRSCSDWHRLIEICSITHTLIADEMGVYDPREPNDRLLLGVKGTLSEAELFTLKTRLYEGRWNKAKKGQLGRSIPTGYIEDANGQWVKDPNIQVQQRIDYVFRLFRRFGVGRQVVATLRQEKLKIPVCVRGGPQHGQLVWKDPTPGAIFRMLKNPAYAGAYVYGMCEYDASRRSVKTGKARCRIREIDDWPVCIKNHHEGYISWDEYLSNRRRLQQNGFKSVTKGAVKKGAALLQGLVWCGRCGAKMGVNTYAAKEMRKPGYSCTHAYKEGSAHTCQSMSSKPIDEVVVSLFLQAMAPAQLEVAIKAAEKMKEEKQTLKKQWEQQLTQARYEVQLAQRQYDAVDPDHRLVAAELERRWNEKLEVLQELETAYAKAEQEARFIVTEQEMDDMKKLAKDLPAVWHAPTTTNQERKQLLRYAISEVQLDGVTTPGKIEIRITWRSGAVTIRQIERLKIGAWAPKTADTVIEQIRESSQKHTVGEIADQLNQQGLRSAHGREFREHHVLYIARRHKIPVTTEKERLQEKSLVH